MLTKNEINALNLSPTKKDFVQIWNELLEVAGRLSERWDPTSTNESDPGIVILKALTGIADKLNYNIDKNTLEAFMPTAAQEDSMRKLCDMLGYSIKYYRSAETTVDIKYYNADASTDEKTALDSGLAIPKFTAITNGDQDINYFTTNQTPYLISSISPAIKSIPCMEGQIVKCEGAADNNAITISQISDNNRFYLPEYQIAENGIFVYNVVNNYEDGDIWEKVDNLNIQARGSRVFKFGYDSYEGRPYLEFPDDYSKLINDGLFIYYTRTSGAGGNISPRVLTQLELPNLENWDKVSAESFSVENAFSATSGANVETITQAYNNFKKTVGTFETLVTCRDYMNKIYTMIDDGTGKPLVSNALVTDIRTDLNRAITICSCDDAGIFYKDVALTKTVTKKLKAKDRTGAIVEVELEDEEPTIDHFDLVLYPFKSYTQIKNNVKDIQAVYDSSFKYNAASGVKAMLDNSGTKTVAHNIISPSEHHIVSINNYLRLNAIIGTTSKITSEECTLLKDKIKIALANAFNMRELDFGDEIPFDSILDVIEKADTRISVVSLAEPGLYTTFSVYEGIDSVTKTAIVREYAVASDYLTEAYADSSDRFEYTNNNATTLEEKYIHTFDTKEAKRLYNKLAVRNILAGRVPLFKYNTTFKSDFIDGAYRITETLSEAELSQLPKTAKDLLQKQDSNFTVYTIDGITYTGCGPADGRVYKKTYAPYENNIIAKDSEDSPNYTSITTKCEIKPNNTDSVSGTTHFSDIELSDGEFIKFRAPNFRTNKTYPAYVNYRLELDNSGSSAETDAKSATAMSLYSLFKNDTANTLKNKLFEHFTNKGKKSFTLTQTVCGKGTDNKGSSSISIIINDSNADTVYTPSKILNSSGFVKIVKHTAELSSEYSDELVGIEKPSLVITNNSVEVTTELSTTSENLNYIFTSGTFEAIKSKVDDYIKMLDSNSLPEHDWVISYMFEYVPFELATLSEWENFIKENSDVLGYTPVREVSNYGVLWRITQGSYSKGKYILDDGISKLWPFTAGHFGLLDENRLNSIYIVEYIGADAVPNYISNDEEYQLRDNEFLYIEYTPSTTTEDGTTQDQEPITETLGKGTIIKPSGFEGYGLLSADALSTSGKSIYKEVTFNNESVGMYSLGASEQIAVRELSKVVLNSETFSDSSTIYVYKNFNDCPELEKYTKDDSGNRINNKYTLKDGEYIFYTDRNKSEFAYFTTGTEVTLDGSSNLVLPKCEIIDLAVIFDGGIEEIDWKPRTFTKSDSLTFQEFQYITLGQKDTIQGMSLAGKVEKLDEVWQKCAEAVYTVVGNDEPARLPKINLSNEYGWEASAVLELNVSPSSSQPLRTTDKIETSLKIYDDYYDESASAEANAEHITTLSATEGYPLSFKANLPCISGSSKLKIADVYTNSSNAKSFEFKIMSEQPPAIIKTAQNRLVPCADSDITDITTWYGTATKTFSTKSYGELWTRVPLTNFVTADDSYDNALKLSVSTLPGTYGIFSIYLKDKVNISSAEATENISVNAWIDFLPGTAAADVRILNNPDIQPSSTDYYVRLPLKPGLNCIRVNNTCDLFIKAQISGLHNTTSEALGVLFFDDLRLVDCKINSNISAYGLNLSQIGYLDAVDDDADTLGPFNLQIRRKLREEYTENAISDINAQAKNVTTSLATHRDILQKSYTKLKNLVKFIEDAKTEISSLANNADDAAIGELLSKYNELRTDLEQEEALKEALADNENLINLEKRLADLLTSLNYEESTRQSLLGELDAIEAIATSKVDSFTKDTLAKGTILDDFEAVASATDEALISDIKLFSLSEVNAEYAAKLDTLGAAIESINDGEAKPRLLAIIKELNITKYQYLVTQLQILVNKKNDGLTALLDTAVEQAGGEIDQSTGEYKVDYAALRASLVSLKECFAGIDIANVLDELSTVINSDTADDAKYVTLIDLIETLAELCSADGAQTGGYAALVASLDTLLETVQNKITSNSTAYDGDITSAVAQLKEGTTDTYINNLSSSLKALQDTLTDLSDDYLEAINTLKSSDDTAIQAILDNLTSYHTLRSAQVASIDAFGTGDTPIAAGYLSLPYGTLSVLSIWPAYMKRTYIIGIAKLYADIRKAIKNTGEIESLTIDASWYANGLIRQALAEAANLDAFQQVFEQTKSLAATASQHTARVQLINYIADLINPSDVLADELNAIIADSDPHAIRNSVLMQLLQGWQAATTVVAKQQYLAELSRELDAVIEIDKQLVDICAKLLCPSILLFPACNIVDIESDQFYDRLCDYIKDRQKDLLIKTENFTEFLYSGDDSVFNYLDNAYTITNSLLTALEAEGLGEFYATNTIISTDESDTLLAEAYLDELLLTKDDLDISVEIANIMSSELIKLLKKDIKVAWQVDENIWVDSNGKACTNDYLDSVDVKRYSAGDWTDNAGNAISIASLLQGIDLNNDTAAIGIVNKLLTDITQLGNAAVQVEASDTLKLETQLLNEIRQLDINREFYYNVPIEANVAINFNESEDKLNTLMNPAMYYDINNVNNNFVISKIDINYLNSGLQIARSSKLS